MQEYLNIGLLNLGYLFISVCLCRGQVRSDKAKELLKLIIIYVIRTLGSLKHHQELYIRDTPSIAYNIEHYISVGIIG